MQKLYIRSTNKSTQQSYDTKNAMSDTVHGIPSVTNDTIILKLSYIINNVLEEFNTWIIWGSRRFTIKVIIFF